MGKLNDQSNFNLTNDIGINNIPVFILNLEVMYEGHYLVGLHKISLQNTYNNQLHCVLSVYIDNT